MGRKEGISYNKTSELVKQMVLDKLEEVHQVIANLQALTQNNNEITTLQAFAIERYIIGCTSFISSSHEFHSQNSRFHV
jgi:hypothetical protein